MVSPPEPIKTILPPEKVSDSIEWLSQWEEKKRKLKVFNCPICGKETLKRGQKKKYCSDRCRTKRHNERLKRLYAADRIKELNPEKERGESLETNTGTDSSNSEGTS